MPANVVRNILAELGVRQVILCQPLVKEHDLTDCSLIDGAAGIQFVTQEPGTSHDLPIPDLSKEAPIFIVATSGSTGKPKCIPVTHDAARLSYQWRDSLLPYRAGQRICDVVGVSTRGLRAFRSRPASRRQRSDLGDCCVN